MQRCNITTTDKTGSSSDAYYFIGCLLRFNWFRTQRYQIWMRFVFAQPANQNCWAAQPIRMAKMVWGHTRQVIFPKNRQTFLLTVMSIVSFHKRYTFLIVIKCVYLYQYKTALCRKTICCIKF